MAGVGGVIAASLLLTLLTLVTGEFYDTFSGRQISPAKYQEYQRLNLVPYCAIEVQPCDENEPRRLDYSCNNLHYPSRGTTLTPYRRMLQPMFDANSDHRPSQSGTPLPNARSIRTAIMSDGRVESKSYTQLVPNSAVFITGDITSVHDTVNYVAVTTTCCASGEADPRCIPIRVPEDDVHLRYSNVRCLNLTKVITYQALGCAPRTLPPERINTSPPLLEMSVIYGNDEKSGRRAREGTGGRLKEETENGARYPPSGAPFCFQNQQGVESRCHNTPSVATNALIGSNIMAIWFWRNHNNIARRLEVLNPCWSDERLFFEAREINIAIMNQIWYYELMPTVIGFDYLLKSKAIFDTAGHINDYDPSLEPRVSIEYVIGTRWFHTIQEGRLKLYDNKGRLLNELKTVELNLRTGILPNNRTLEGLTQGSFRQPTADSDHLIDPDMGERVLGGLQVASDVASSDIMKSREAGLPPYNHYRKLCGLPVAKDFEHLRGWMNQEQIDGLKLTYEDVNDIDFMVGIMAERRMRGAIVGPTLACVMTDQLLWWRRADRFWYENAQHPGAFTPEQLREIRRITLSRLICDNGDEVDKIQPFAYFVPKEDNELIDCNLLPTTRLDPWKDEQCQIEINNTILEQQQLDIKSNKQSLNLQTVAFNKQQANLPLFNVQAGIDLNSQNQLNIQNGIGINNQNQQQLNIQAGIDLNGQTQQQLNIQNGIGINSQNQQQLNIQGGIGLNNQNQQQLNIQGGIGINNQNQQQLNILNGIGINHQNQQQLNIQGGIGLNNRNQQQLNIQGGIDLNNQNQQQLNILNGIGINNQNQEQLNIQGGIDLNNQNQQQLNIKAGIDLNNQNQQTLTIQPIGLNIQSREQLDVGLNIGQQNANNQNNTNQNNQTKSNQTGLNNPVLTSAIASNVYWDPTNQNNWNQNNWDLNNWAQSVTNWGPGYYQNMRWGPNFVTTQSPNNNQDTNEIGNKDTQATLASKPLFTPNLKPVNWVNLNTPGWLDIVTGVNSPIKNPTGGAIVPTVISPGLSAPIGNKPDINGPINKPSNNPGLNDPGVKGPVGNTPSGINSPIGSNPGGSAGNRPGSGGDKASVNGPSGNNPGGTGPNDKNPGLQNGGNTPNAPGGVNTNQPTPTNTNKPDTTNNSPITTAMPENTPPTNVMPLRPSGSSSRLTMVPV